MRLNKKKWIQEVRQVEAEIKELKKKMHEPDYQKTFSYYKLFILKAKATRLYTLRRVMKKKDVQLKSFWYLLKSSSGEYEHAYSLKTDGLSAEQIVSIILDGVPSWKKEFLLEDLPTAYPLNLSLEGVIPQGV